ncbi:ADP-ribosyl glycohydrolase [Acanthocystis turfacea Chlorella virus Canal-1]|nr:ADP-ribosyl glycohydrolase [Acanthocystis turfacea Chlorella virus Canal-1]
MKLNSEDHSGRCDMLDGLTYLEDRSLGCVIGAFLGDSIGSFLEFKRNVTIEEAHTAWELPGGGPFRLSPGQITDDSELSLCLARGILDGISSGEGFNCDRIAKRYAQWLLSRPFDIGKTTTAALFKAAQRLESSDDHTGLANVCRQFAFERNLHSESNGGLMRLSPLIVFCSRIDDEDMVKCLVIEEQSLTHSNVIARKAAVAFVLAARHIIREGDVEGALHKVREYVRTNKEIDDYWSQTSQEVLLHGNVNMGWSKIAWSYSFQMLRQRLSYKEAILSVLLQGGDTDTNAAIVGSMIGAAMGFKSLYKEAKTQIDVLLKCDPTIGDQPRPVDYAPNTIIQLVKEILDVNTSAS